MNTVQVFHVSAPLLNPWKETWDVNEAMDLVHEIWAQGKTAVFEGPFGNRYLEPPIEDLIAQLPDCSSTLYDDSPAGHERRRINRHLP